MRVRRSSFEGKRETPPNDGGVSSVLGGKEGS